MFVTDNEKLVAALKWVLVSFSCYVLTVQACKFEFRF